MSEPNDAGNEAEQLALREAVRARFAERGVSVAWWASERGYPKSLVYAVINGRLAAKRGRAHKIAVDLGIRPGPTPLGDNNPLQRLDAILARAPHSNDGEGHDMS